MLLLSLTYAVQKIPQHAHVFFLWSTVRLDPCHQTWSPSSQCHNEIIQVLRLGIMIMFEPCHHRETASHSQLSLAIRQPGQQVWVAVLISQQPTRRNKTFVRMFFTQKHIIPIHVKHQVSMYVCLFFCTVSPTAVRNQRRGCLLKQDMSAGEDDNCCSGRLSIGNLQGHTPWVFFWVPSRASSRLTA